MEATERVYHTCLVVSMRGYTVARRLYGRHRSVRTAVALTMALLCLWGLTVICFRTDDSLQQSRQGTTWDHLPPYPTTLLRRRDEYRRILLWTSWFEWNEWFFGGLGTKPFVQRSCPESRCILTTDPADFFESDLVLVHIRNLEKGAQSMPPTHPVDQRWVYMIMESPTNTWLATPSPEYKHSVHDLSPLDSMFNLTMTYLQESDIRISYGRYVPLSRPAGAPSRNYAEGKDKLALWYVSNCFTEQSKMRSSFVEELRRYIPVDVYGLCGDPDPCDNKNECAQRLKTRYKFYLALENSLCRDYVSEKLWNTYRSGLLPVVLGAGLDEYLKVAPPDSFLHVDNFTSVEALAKYMKYLDAHDEAYNAYFKWRERYEIAEQNRSAISQAVCDVCKVAHQDIVAPKTYKISDWWSAGRLCKSRYWGMDKKAKK